MCFCSYLHNPSLQGEFTTGFSPALGKAPRVPPESINCLQGPATSSPALAGRVFGEPNLRQRYLTFGLFYTAIKTINLSPDTCGKPKTMKAGWEATHAGGYLLLWAACVLQRRSSQRSQSFPASPTSRLSYHSGILHEISQASQCPDLSPEPWVRRDTHLPRKAGEFCSALQ